MLHWKLENKEQARDWFDKAIKWIEENKPDNELGRLRMKAAELMGIDIKDEDTTLPSATTNDELQIPEDEFRELITTNYSH